MFRFKEAFLAKYKGKAIAGIKEGGKNLPENLAVLFHYIKHAVYGAKAAWQSILLFKKDNGSQDCQWTETSPRQFDVRP